MEPYVIPENDPDVYRGPSDPGKVIYAVLGTEGIREIGRKVEQIGQTGNPDDAIAAALGRSGLLELMYAVNQLGHDGTAAPKKEYLIHPSKQPRIH